MTPESRNGYRPRLSPKKKYPKSMFTDWRNSTSMTLRGNNLRIEKFNVNDSRAVNHPLGCRWSRILRPVLSSGVLLRNLVLWSRIPASIIDRLVSCKFSRSYTLPNGHSSIFNNEQLIVKTGQRSLFIEMTDF